MKYSPRFTYTFTPGSSTLNLSANAGFSVNGLMAVVDVTARTTIYAVGQEGLGYSAYSAGTLTLQASMTGLAAADTLAFFYDDGLAPGAYPIATGTNSIGSVVQGTPGTTANAWPSKLTDGINTAAVKAASTAAVATDSPLVVAHHPSSPTPPGTNTIGGVTGDVAAGTADANAPQKIGGQARLTNPTPVTDGQRVNAIFDKLGKQVVVGAVRALMGRQRTNIAASTAETTIITAGAAGVFNDLYGLIITNNNTAAMAVTIREVAAGTPAMVFQVPVTNTVNIMLPVSSAIPQTTAASAWTAACTPNATSADITALFVRNT